MPPTEGDDRMKNWTAILILAAAQFVMVLDSSVMNVSISQIVADLDTTIQGVQLAITAYTLVMAAFMLTGAKLGDIWGRDRTFAIGLVVYATGSLITALSPNLGVLLIGWSLIEGLGAVLVVPAIAALIAANYEGKERALAYGLIGGVAAAAVAVGPIIGGWVTTNYTWRYVFVGEVVIVAVILLVRNRMKKSPQPENPPKLDLVGAALSASGFGFIVFGILQSSSWGWVQPKGALTINGNEITPLGFSVVPFLILGGLGLLATLSWWVNRRQARGEAALLDMSMLSIKHAPGGALDARLAAARPDGHVLRAAGVPPGRARPGRVQHRPEAAADVDHDVPRRAARAAGRRPAVAAAGRPGVVRAPRPGLRDHPRHDRHRAQLEPGSRSGWRCSASGSAGSPRSWATSSCPASTRPRRTRPAASRARRRTSARRWGRRSSARSSSAASPPRSSTGSRTTRRSPPSSRPRSRTTSTRDGPRGHPGPAARGRAHRRRGAAATRQRAVAADYGQSQLDGLRNALFAVAVFAVLSVWFTRRLPGESTAAPAPEPDPAPVAVAAT